MRGFLRGGIWGVLLTACLVACSGDLETEPVSTEETPVSTAPEVQAADAGDESEEDAADDAGLFDLDVSNFEDSTTIDNRYFPIVPGTQFVYEGTAIDDGEEVDRMVIFTVTDLTKMINGVEAAVVWDRDFNDGVMIESEIVFFAQDRDGTVWHLGQYRETYDEDEFVGGRVWLVDLPEGAKAGIFMHADPQPGTPSYSQGFAPEPFNWTDRARISEIGIEDCVELGCHEDVIVIEEIDEENPGQQLKYYAPGVGNTRVGWSGDDPEQEEMELIELNQLTAEEMDEVRAEALALEMRAYMYGHTEPARRTE